MRSLVTLLFLVVASTRAFVVPSPIIVQPRATASTSTTNMVLLHLHPDQAPDLEACAYDLMKAAAAAKVAATQLHHSSNTMSQAMMNNNEHHPHHGPLGWMRRFFETKLLHKTEASNKETSAETH
jgi:hypothetical protein